MKVSRAWLQKFFNEPLPPTEALAEALTFHAAEIEEADGDMLDVKVLPDRACYLLSHRGVAYELSASLALPLADDPLAKPAPAFAPTGSLSITTCDPVEVPRFMGAVVKGVTVGPSPEWLRAAIESIGQRSINNVVDAANYAMFHLGQPLHAFDAGKLEVKDGAYALLVRHAYEGERITTLTGEDYLLPEGTLVVADGNTDAALGIAGIKGGKAAEVTASTTDLVIEAANFDATMVRRAAQALKLFTDASLRFQNRPSPELVGYGMQAVLELILDVAGGKVEGVVDIYPQGSASAPVMVTLERINSVLGTAYALDDVLGALDRLILPYSESDGAISATPHFVRSDLRIPEDLIEEVGRVLGYDQVPAAALAPLPSSPDQRRYRGIERAKDILLERGYIEISTPSFAKDGEVELANPLQMDRPFLRPGLSGNMREALARAKREAPRVLGPDPSLKLFEVGGAFTKEGEKLALALGYEPLAGKASASILDEDIEALMETVPGLTKPSHDGTVAELTLNDAGLEAAGEGYEPKDIILGPYTPYSPYPFALRDIAVWVPEGTAETQITTVIAEEAGELLARLDLFDRFEKDGRTSYAFRLVFEAPDRTLSDADLDPVMARITEALNSTDGFSVR